MSQSFLNFAVDSTRCYFSVRVAEVLCIRGVEDKACAERLGVGILPVLLMNARSDKKLVREHEEGARDGDGEEVGRCEEPKHSADGKKDVETKRTSQT